jgi:hypothetical protein
MRPGGNHNSHIARVDRRADVVGNTSDQIRIVFIKLYEVLSTLAACMAIHKIYPSV